MRKFRFKDKDGSVKRIKGKIIDKDVPVRDSKLYVMEVKSRAELDHVEYLVEKAKFVEIAMERKVIRSWW